MSVIFHLAFPVTNLAETKQFYIDGLRCTAGREGHSSLILNLHGHQLVAHVTKEPPTPQKGIYPRHFGLVFLKESNWQDLMTRAKDNGLPFYQLPKRRFEGSVLDHLTFFLRDPFHNLLEFKHYYHPSAIFGEIQETQVGDSAAKMI